MSKMRVANKGITVLFSLLVGGFAGSAWAAWNGAGVAGGSVGATNINDTANWTDNAINGDFRPIISNATLRLTSDCTFTSGVDLASVSASAVRHVVIEGTNRLILSGTVLPGYSTTFNRHLYLASNNTCSVTLSKGLTFDVQNGNRTFGGHSTLFIDAKVVNSATVSGNMTFSYTGGNNPFIVFRNDANTFTNNIYGDGGNIHFTSLANKGKPCAFGTGTAVAINNYTIVYIGSRDTFSNRDLTLQNSNAGVRNDSACGGLCFTGMVYIGGSVHSDIYLDGISAGENLISGNIPNYSTNFFTKLDKRHSGTWRLTGKNTFTGWTNNLYHVNLQGGTLIADYLNDLSGAGSNRLFAAGRSLQMNDARLVLRGKAGAGNTTWQEFVTNTVSDGSHNVLTVDGNGGDGTTVSLGPIVMSGGLGFLRTERLGNATVRTPSAVPSASDTLRNINGVLMGASGTRANFLAKDPDGRVGFATQTGDNEIVRYTDTLAMTSANSDKTNHFSLAADLTRTANLNFSTLSLDASANAVTLDMGGFSLQTDNSTLGRGVVVNGSFPVTVRNGAHGAQSSTFLYNYGSGKLSWELMNGNCVYVAAGPGLIEFTQPLSNTFHVVEGTVRLTAEQNFTNSAILMMGNGVLEIGADLNGGTAGDFTRGLGFSGPNQIGFYAGGGFSAYGADRTVNIGGTGASLVWNQNGTPGFVQEGKPLLFSSPHANATLIFQNPIIFQNRAREIRVQNGSAVIDARLTGKISGSANPVAGLVKSGAGTLELTAAQDYRGTVSVIGGGLLLGASDVYAGGTNALVLSNATLDAGTGRNAFNTLDILADSRLATGNGSATLSFADCREMGWTGKLEITGKLGPTTLRFGTDQYSLTSAQLASITCRGFSVRLDKDGYLTQNPPGTMISVR